MSLFDQKITVRHPEGATQDSMGNDMQAQWRETTVYGWYELRSSSRDVDAADQRVSGYWLYLQAGTTFTAESQAFLGGQWHKVDGEAKEQPGGYILGGYMPIALTVTTG